MSIIISFGYNRVKKSLPEEAQRKTKTSLFTALLSASLATLMCYPLDTVRRQMQMKGTPYKTVFDAFAGNLVLVITRQFSMQIYEL